MRWIYINNHAKQYTILIYRNAPSEVDICPPITWLYDYILFPFTTLEKNSSRKNKRVTRAVFPATVSSTLFNLRRGSRTTPVIFRDEYGDLRADI